MAFETLDTRMRAVAEQALTFCRQKYGNNGLRIDQGIDSTISWRPTFYCRPTQASIVAIEVSDKLYPEALKIAAHDIGFYDVPVAVYQVCSLDAYQNDPKQARVNQMGEHGFGLITVDDDGLTKVQHSAVPLAQHIPESQVEKEIKPLTAKLKVAFRGSYESYKANIGQGLQQAGQIVEGIVLSIADQASKDGHIPSPKGKLAATVIDELYQTPKLKDHRAALGAARAFMKEFRNIASHSPKSARQASDKMRKCKAGYLEAIGTACKLVHASKQLSYRIKIHTT